MPTVALEPARSRRRTPGATRGRPQRGPAGRGRLAGRGRERSAAARAARRRTRVVLSVALLLLAVVGALLLRERATGATYPITASQLAQARTDLSALMVVDVPRAPAYDRGAYGPAWADVDRNGCDTRNDVLARDLTATTFKPGTRGCVVQTGRLADRYTGQVIEFQRGQDTSSHVQVDHVVALADAWRSGAHSWTTDQRNRFANDPQNLLAVDGPANQAKGASSAADWLPPERGFRCQYVVMQVTVKARWALSVTDAEQRAMDRTLDSCVTLAGTTPG